MCKPLPFRCAATYRIFFESVQAAAGEDVSLPANICLTMDRLLFPMDMDVLLDTYGRSLQAPHPAVAGSMLAKMLGRTLTGLWKLLSVHNYQVRLNLPEVTLVWSEIDMAASLYFPNDACTPLPQLPDERSDARDEWFRNTIYRNLRPLLETISFRCGLSKTILWENVYIYLNHGYSGWLKEAAAAGDEADFERIASDYSTLTREGSPFHIPSTTFESPLQPGEQLRIRRTCCLKHTLPNGTPCYSCPSVCASKRKEIYLGKK